jgi:hypothetical protein
MPPKRKRPITPPLRSFDARVPGTEYDTPRKAGLHLGMGRIQWPEARQQGNLQLPQYQQEPRL